MFRGDLKAELNWYHPRGEAIITAFVDGVNAYIAEALRSPSTLPIEFGMLGIKPGAVDARGRSSRGTTGCSSNIGQELNMAQAVRVLGAEKVKELQYFQGGDPDLTPDPAIDLSLLERRRSSSCTTRSAGRSLFGLRRSQAAREPARAAS